LCGKRLHQILAGAICEIPLISFLPTLISIAFQRTYNAFQCPRSEAESRLNGAIFSARHGEDEIEAGCFLAIPPP
jgi:hypothetical protein